MRLLAVMNRGNIPSSGPPFPSLDLPPTNSDRLDVGGTPTVVSRFNSRYEVMYETTTAGATIQSPQLDITAAAAGSGSCLAPRNGLFRTGSESMGAQLDPTCYR
jgi:N-methylhydantoinase A/oxoprolinase/acetone carboxylase beta subunit